MLCSNCTKLVFLHANKSCIRCHGNVVKNISILCEQCSSTGKQCSVCLKKVTTQAATLKRGCNCGGK
jgi:hypothetical protein